MNVNWEQMLMFLTIFVSLILAIYNEYLDAAPVSFKMSLKQWIKEMMLETWQEHLDGVGIKVKVDMPSVWGTLSR